MQFGNGRIALGTYETEVRFRNVKVIAPDGKVLWQGLPKLKVFDQPLNQDDGFVPLFNKKNLDGWIDRSGERHDWGVGPLGNLFGRRVQDPKMLLSQRADYQNFHLRVRTVLNETSIAAIHFGIPENWSHIGYNVQTGSTRPTERLLGDVNEGLTVLRRAKRLPILPDEWFWMELIMKGHKLTVKVKNEVVNQYTFQSPIKGRIGFSQAANNHLVVSDIEIKEMPTSNPAP